MSNAEPQSALRERSVRVSVVIPSLGRQSLTRAVDSALEQSRPPSEIFVVFDAAEVPNDLKLPASVTLLTTGGGKGPNFARQLGIDASTGDAIALLDDDDFWYRDKLTAQVAILEAARAEGVRAVVSAVADCIDQDGRIVRGVTPRALDPGQRLADYLFRRREIRPGGAGIGPSSLLIERELLDELPLRTDLWVHEDWDWLLHAEQLPRVRISQLVEPQWGYRVTTLGTPVATTELWPASVAWANEHRDLLTPREYGDFLVAVSAPRAIDAGQRGKALLVVWQALREGRPGLAALSHFAGLWLTPRHTGRQLLFAIDRVRTQFNASARGQR